MTAGQVYIWERRTDEPSGGAVRLGTVPLRWLDRPAADIPARLRGRFVSVSNDGILIDPASSGLDPAGAPIGDACADAEGRFIWDPAAGGGRRATDGARAFLDADAYVDAAHFGEVNAYHHITLIAQYVDELLESLGARPLPPVRAVVNAHRQPNGKPTTRRFARDADGALWEPVRNSRYRAGYIARDGESPIVRGEIQLSQGFRLTKDGWLARLAGGRYRCSGAHIAPTLYRLYGHHIARHTADFSANDLVPPAREDNSRTPTMVAISDYWAATMLGAPNIRCWHDRIDNDGEASGLDNALTTADARRTGRDDTLAAVLSGALWDIRARIGDAQSTVSDRLTLGALLSVRQLWDDAYKPDRDATRAARDGGDVFAACLIHADELWFDGDYSALIHGAFARRGVGVCEKSAAALRGPRAVPTKAIDAKDVAERGADIRSRFPDAVIPTDAQLVSPDELDASLRRRRAHYDLVAVGDVMTGMRMRHRIRRFGTRYVFAWTAPILERAAVAVGNQEGPFAEDASLEETTRNFAYKVDPQSAVVLRQGGFTAMSIANNHIMDCGPTGVAETLDALETWGLAAVGGGRAEATAHEPAIFETRGGRLGVVGYYWNRRTAARGDAPGSARDLPDLVERDLARLRPLVDRIAVTVHWGAPYEREPSPEDREKARHFIDCGADIVIGHHPHIIQPLEIYRGRPIFYSVGNFAFGSGNSRAESLLIGARFAPDGIEVDIFPVYVQNRDPRLDYQPKIMRGEAARETLNRLTAISGEHGPALRLRDHMAALRTDGAARRRATAFDQLMIRKSSSAETRHDSTQSLST